MDLHGASDLVEFRFYTNAFDTTTLGIDVVVGVQNILDSFPEESPNATALGNLYPENAPASTNGGFWYTRLEARL